jgi:hypothetical protein
MSPYRAGRFGTANATRWQAALKVGVLRRGQQALSDDKFVMISQWRANALGLA